MHEGIPKKKKSEFVEGGPKTIDDFVEQIVERTLLQATQMALATGGIIDPDEIRRETLERIRPRRKLAERKLAEMRKANKALEYPSAEPDMVVWAWDLAGSQLTPSSEE